jgi:glycogen synthase
MDILMLGWEFPPFYSGGLGTHCFHLTKALSSLGMKLTFFMPKNPYHVSSDYMKIVEIDPSFMIGPYSFTPMVFENYSRNFFDDVWKYNTLCVERALLENFDLVHAHDWLTSIAALEIKRRTGKPLAITIHATEYDRCPLSPNKWILERETAAVKGADLIITVSEMMKKQLIERFGANPNKVVVIYNAIEHSEWISEKIEKTFSGHKVVLFVGRVTMQKGPDFFLRAAKRVLEKNPDARFAIAGKGDMLPQVIKEAVSLGISDKVMILGYVPDEELANLYSSADVFVLPSVSEPFGITALEAMASRVPTILSRQSGVREIVKSAFVVDFWDIDEIANKILALLNYPSLHGSMRKNAHEEISSLTWSKVAGETKKVYGRLLA